MASDVAAHRNPKFRNMKATNAFQISPFVLCGRSRVAIILDGCTFSDWYSCCWSVTTSTAISLSWDGDKLLIFPPTSLQLPFNSWKIATKCKTLWNFALYSLHIPFGENVCLETSLRCKTEKTNSPSDLFTFICLQFILVCAISDSCNDHKVDSLRVPRTIVDRKKCELIYTDPRRNSTARGLIARSYERKMLREWKNAPLVEKFTREKHDCEAVKTSEFLSQCSFCFFEWLADDWNGEKTEKNTTAVLRLILYCLSQQINLF